jgi:hypothetical protein
LQAEGTSRTLPTGQLDFTAWAKRWIDLARFNGSTVPDEEARIEALIKLWRAEIPAGWKRSQDVRLVERTRRYCRRNAGPHDLRRGEHIIEYDLLLSDSVVPTCLGALLVDDVNAVPLARDVGGARNGNVEADLLLLVKNESKYRLLLVEVKVGSNNAWYATVENLRQLKLISNSTEAQRLFHTRCPELKLPHPLPVTGVVLAPESFFNAQGVKAATVAPAEKTSRATA